MDQSIRAWDLKIGDRYVRPDGTAIPVARIRRERSGIALHIELDDGTTLWAPSMAIIQIRLADNVVDLHEEQRKRLERAERVRQVQMQSIQRQTGWVLRRGVRVWRGPNPPGAA